jgi:hypothetical protein
MEAEIILNKIIRGNIIALSVLVKKDDKIKGFIVPVFKIDRDNL